MLDRGYLQKNKGRLQTIKTANIIYLNTVFIWSVELKKVSATFAGEDVQWNTTHQCNLCTGTRTRNKILGALFGTI